MSVPLPLLRLKRVGCHVWSIEAFSIRCVSSEAWEHVAKFKVSHRHRSIPQPVSKLVQRLQPSSALQDSQAVLPSHGE